MVLNTSKERKIVITLNTHQYLAHSDSRLCCEVLDIVKSFGYPVCKLECSFISEKVADSATAFVEGGIYFKNRFFLIAPNDPEERIRFIEKRGLLKPEQFMNVSKLVFVRSPPTGEMYRGEELLAFKEKLLNQICSTPLPSPKTKRHRKWRYGRHARRLRDQGLSLR